MAEEQEEEDGLVRGSVTKPDALGAVQSFSIAMASADGRGEELRARSRCGVVLADR